MTRNTERYVLHLGALTETPWGEPSSAVDITLELRTENGADGPELSICGSVWDRRHRDVLSGGQNIDTIGWLFPQREDVQRIVAIWERWHLNHMRAGCEHQTGADWEPQQVEVCAYHLTKEARQLRDEARSRAIAAGEWDPKRLAVIYGEPLPRSATENALMKLPTAYEERHSAPDADDALSGCYEVTKRERKWSNQVYPSEHPRGTLMKPCATCGYKYGSEWRKETLPPDVLAEVRALFGAS